MIPGEVTAKSGEIELNAGRTTVELDVANTGDRPIQVGSHYHFFETNPALQFDRDKARGFRLDIPAGTAVRFEPGQRREVQLGLAVIRQGRLSLAVADHLAAAELDLLTVDRAVRFNFDDEIGVGEAQPVAGRRPEHRGIGGARQGSRHRASPRRR